MVKSAFTDRPCQRYTTGSVGPVNGINKKVSGARLLSTIPLDKSEDHVHLCECDGSSD